MQQQEAFICFSLYSFTLIMNNWKKKFIIIWSGQLFSILSSSIAQFSIVLWISLKTGSAEVLSFAMIAALLPQALLGAFAGVYVDRWNRKWTMIGADSFVALCSGIIALLFYLDIVELWHIYILLALRSIGGSFHSPAMKSSIPLLAPEKELTRIAGINQAIQSICNIGGPALGAVLLLAFDMSVVMLLDVAGAIIACTSLLFVYIPNPKKENISAKSVLNDMRDGFHVIMRNRGVSWVMVTEILITFFVLPIVALMPLMTLHTFSGTAYQISLIETLFGMVFDTYWLIQFEDKLFIIDQHAAHEKVKYERLMKQFYEKSVVSQRLMPAIIVSLTGQEESILHTYEDAFAQLGFEIDAFGGNEYALRSVPVDLYGCSERELFLAVLDELSQETGNRGSFQVIEEKIASMSCKAAVKGNNRLSFQEAEKLIDELLTLDNPYNCPHGRPTIIP